MKTHINNSRTRRQELGAIFSLILFLSFSAILPAISQTASNEENRAIPHLAKHGAVTQLIVDGKPFLMLAGETGNSSASDL